MAPLLATNFECCMQSIQSFGSSLSRRQGLGGPRRTLMSCPRRNSAYVYFLVALLVIVFVGVYFYVTAPAHRRNPGTIRQGKQEQRSNTAQKIDTPFQPVKQAAAPAMIHPDPENM